MSPTAGTWAKFRDGRENIKSEEPEIHARQNFRNEEALITALYKSVKITHFYTNIYMLDFEDPPYLKEDLFSAMLDLFSRNQIKSPLAYLLKHEICFYATKEQLQSFKQGNNSKYQQLRDLSNNTFGNDISSNRLWCATFLHQAGDFSIALALVNDVLSSIPPYALYHSGGRLLSNEESVFLYKDTILTREFDALTRTKKAWLFDMVIMPADYDSIPPAIRIELFYLYRFDYISVSPFTYAYYLMFLCYHCLGQHDKRDRALRQLADTVMNPEQLERSNITHHSYNIVGHCLLVAEQVDMARLLFSISIEISRIRGDEYEKHNSAYHY